MDPEHREKGNNEAATAAVRGRLYPLERRLREKKQAKIASGHPGHERRFPRLAAGWGGGLRENLFHDLAVNVGEAVVAALEAERELRVVHAHLVEDCGLQIVNVNLLL